MTLLLLAAAITESTPISIALAVGVVAVAFTAGVGLEHLRGRVARVEEKQADQADWQDAVDEILGRLTVITQDHELRLKLRGH